MNQGEEMRRFPRLSTGTEYCAHFKVPGGARIQAQMQNISACGCGLQVEMADMERIENGVHLEAFFLDHDDLPYVPFHGTVTRVLGKVPGKSVGYALVGVDFSPITPFMMNLINAHVLRHLGQS